MVRLKGHFLEEFINLSKTYGPIYTFWMGNTPFVMIMDLKSAREAFVEKKNDCSGRPEFKIRQFNLF